MKASKGIRLKDPDSGELNRIWTFVWERLAGLGAMVIGGVEAGEGDPAPARAVVGSALVALRDDLHKFMGWVVEVQGGTEDNQPAGDGHAHLRMVKFEPGRIFAPLKCAFMGAHELRISTTC